MASSCVTITDKRACTAAGVLSAGGICAHTNYDETNDLSFNEFLDFLEAQPERSCVPVPGMNICSDNQAGNPEKLPARGAAVCMSSLDWGTLKTELEVACRELGARCSYQVQQILSKMP